MKLDMQLYPELSQAEVARVGGELHYSRGWREGYSLKNEAETDAWISAVMNRKYLLKVSHLNDIWVGAHWLKNMDHAKGTAWFNGIIFEAARGPSNYWLQMRDWELFEEWAAGQGFHTLLCAVFATNARSLKWSRERCLLTEIGVREKASPRQPDGEMSDCVVFAKCWQEAITAPMRRQIMAWVDEALPGAWVEPQSVTQLAG